MDEPFSLNGEAKKPLDKKAYNAAYRLAHGDELRAKSREKRKTEGDKVRAQARARYAENAEHYRAKAKAYSAANAEKKRAYREANRERHNARDREYKRANKDKNRAKLNGITLERFREIEQAQDFRCAICRTPFNLVYTHLDHDHKSGKVRGILCSRCNNGLGMFSDDPKLLITAAKYVKHHAKES